ncbi:hypothetical protein SD80_018375 [Scytonema tolypothrichoides VB-61278]|nr:hypothetical protein SD80_018375 [Scytonema tolypothrichoides VB-61278]
MTNIFTPEEIDTITSEIDNQLSELRTSSVSDSKEGETEETKALPVKQSQVIEKMTQENPESFLKKFARAAKSDLCQEGGVLNTQWKKWADLNNQDVIDKFSIALVALGFSGNMLQILVVAVAVIVIHIGVKAFCENYS